MVYRIFRNCASRWFQLMTYIKFILCNHQLNITFLEKLVESVSFSFNVLSEKSFLCEGSGKYKIACCVTSAAMGRFRCRWVKRSRTAHSNIYLSRHHSTRYMQSYILVNDKNAQLKSNYQIVYCLLTKSLEQPVF